ncbi:MAG: hypothetical protein ACD_60C00028G0069 [uncultured bacterium]|nr:MAG: hypothetical protein ACD_60C00028G0069 [uncultured bacterium]
MELATNASDQALNETITFQHQSQNQLAFTDLLSGLKSWRVWTLLAYQDIKLRYRRSVLGPFWITISMAITAYTMGYLYGHLFRSDLDTYIPYLTAGLLGWALISNSILELTETFTNYEGMLKQIKLPYSLYIHRVAARNILIFFHNVVVIVPVLIIFHKVAKINLDTLLLLPCLLIFYVNAIAYGFIFAMIGARYRDIGPIIKNFVQVIFFVTPIMWRPDVLPLDKQFIVAMNPVNSFLEIIRAPLLGHVPSAYDMKMTFLITLIGILAAYKMFVRYRARIVYWV